MAATGEPRSIIDLHTHTTASDGTTSPADLVAEARARGIHVLAVTDHDSTDGLDEAMAAGHRLGVTIIPGVELGTEPGRGEVHLLGYFIDHQDPTFQQRLATFRAGRERRVEAIVERLRQLGVPIELAHVRQHAAGGAIGRAHVARALVAQGYAASVDDAFARYLGYGRPAYVPRVRLSAPEAVVLIHAAGGVAVLAHPLTVDALEDELAALVAAGLDGIEVYYAAYSPAEHAMLAALAARYGLIPTGGSDYHGPGQREGRELGAAPVPPATVARLRRAARRVR
ncbi:MAG: PHP domain-containing protein [Sphaerobacter sp.]|nr:PHP domain-containing protein [Sphaerobacter sp.]